LQDDPLPGKALDPHASGDKSMRDPVAGPSASSPVLDRADALAVDAVRDACLIACRAAAAAVQSSALVKQDTSPVTVADFAVQLWLGRALAPLRPGLRLVAEETRAGLEQAGPAMWQAIRAVLPEVIRPADPTDLLAWMDEAANGRDGSDYWLLDPIDGTKGFLRSEQYAVCLARIRQGRPVFALMGCPALPVSGLPGDAGVATGVLVLGIHGMGSWQKPLAGSGQWRRIRCADVEAGVGTLRVCESRDAAHGQHGLLDEALQAIDIRPTPVRLDSQCKYVLVARGDADVFVRLPRDPGYVERAWDHAAGSLIAAEAGASVTDLAGRPLDFSTGAALHGTGILVAAPLWHQRLLAALGKGGPPAKR
jgi:HAL2 family 3'(2'),5'-bisphosphate nucleotidase